MVAVESKVVAVTHLFAPERASLIDLLSRRRDGAAPADTPSKPVGFQELVASLDR